MLQNATRALSIPNHPRNHAIPG